MRNQISSPIALAVIVHKKEMMIEVVIGAIIEIEIDATVIEREIGEMIVEIDLIEIGIEMKTRIDLGMILQKYQSYLKLLQQGCKVPTQLLTKLLVSYLMQCR